MIDYTKFILSNGLTVIAEQDKSTNLAAINILYKVGSRDEDPNRTGFAHLFEHLMFGGSLNAPDFDLPLQNAGGENNAYTNSDYTNYYDLVPVENIEVALWLEADRMAQLNIDSKSLEVQRKVVIEEFKEVCLNKPYGDNWHHVSAMAYKKHSYGWPTIGKVPEHIQDATIDDVRAFHQKYYHPSNAIIAISSALPPNESIRLVEKWFGHIPDRTSDVSVLDDEEIQESLRYMKLDADVPSPVFIGGCHMPGRNHVDYYACDLLSDILSNGHSSRLYIKLVRELKIMTFVDCHLSGTFDPGLIILEGRPAANISVKKALENLWAEINRLHTDPPTDRELQKVKNKAIASIAMNDLSVLNKSASLAYFEWLGAIELMNKQEEMYNAVTIGDILRVAGQYLVPSNASILEYVPLD